GPPGPRGPRPHALTLPRSHNRSGSTPMSRIVGILGGMGPLATADLYRKIILATPAGRDQDHLHVIIDADPSVPDRSAALRGEAPDPTPWLLRGARRLEAAGAAFIAVPCNTAHAFLPALRPQLAIPILATIEEFAALDLRVGRVLEATDFPQARKPAYRLTIDFGPLGVRRSSAQLTALYRPDELVGRLVVAVVNFPPRQIGPFISEVLVLGAYDEAGEVILLHPDRAVVLGAKIG